MRPEAKFSMLLSNLGSRMEAHIGIAWTWCTIADSKFGLRSQNRPLQTCAVNPQSGNICKRYCRFAPAISILYLCTLSLHPCLCTLLGEIMCVSNEGS